MSALSPQDEERLMRAVREAGELVDSGTDPQQAIAKLARDNKFTPGEIEMLCHAYNTGRQLCQFREQKSLLDKLADYPLADARSVIRDVYGSDRSVKHAASTLDYHLPPSSWRPVVRHRSVVVKTAAVSRRPAAGPRERFGTYERVKQAYEAARIEACQARRDLDAALTAVTDYFRRDLRDRQPLAAVEKAAMTQWGSSVGLVFDALVAALRLREKRAADGLPVLTRPLDLRAEPFVSLRRVVDAASRVAVAEARLRKVASAYAAARDAVVGPEVGPRYRPPRPASDGLLLTAAESPTLIPEKQAFTMPMVGMYVGTSVSRALGPQPPKTKDKLIRDVYDELTSPTHQAQLRNIRAQAVLAELMTDPESPLSGHDPKEVLRHYNEIVRLAPRLADQPAALRPLLARRLQGNVQPFEAKELADIGQMVGRLHPNIYYDSSGPGDSDDKKEDVA